MANGFDKLSIKSAVKSRNKFDLSRTHLTTMDIGQIIPLFVEETVPGDKFNVDCTYFSRMAPLVKPTYGKLYFKTMEVFVPYYQVSDGIDAWMAGKTSWEGSATTSRYIIQSTLLDLFGTTTNGLSENVSSTDVGNGAWYDFCYYWNSSTMYRRFTAKGKYFIKIFNSLGYVIPENANTTTSSSWMTGVGASKLSALPLLAFLKGYNDWMSQSQRFNVSTLTAFLKSVKHDVTYTVSGDVWYDSSTHTITRYGLLGVFSQVVLTYENDYFTSAWQEPNAPLITGDGNIVSVQVPGIPTDNDDTITDSVYRNYLQTIAEVEGSADEEGNVAGNATIKLAQRSLDWLKSFDDFVRRNNYSGSRAVQAVYSRFGIKTEDYKSNYAKLIDKSTLPIQVGDVTALGQDFVSAGSEKNVELGDYAGKGILSGNGSFNYEAKDYGLLMVLGWYTVDPMNVYGFDRTVLRNTPLDYYNPEFDGVGPDPISIAEVWSNPRVYSSTVAGTDATFGFTERYNSYRFGKDRITGDFRTQTLVSGSYATTGTEMNVWHTGRMLTGLRNSGTLVAQNSNFNTLPQTGSEYNRIFSITDNSVDHFYMTAQFRVTAIRPMLNLNQVPKLGEGDTVVPRNGNEIN